jgi:hypothetical protein
MSEIRNKVFSHLPVYPVSFFNNSILMKKLNKTHTGIYTGNKNKNTQQNSQSNGNINVASNLLENSSKVINPGENPYINTELYKKDPNGFAAKMNKFPQNAVLIDKNSITNFDMFKSMLTSGNTQGGIIYSDPNSIKISLMIKKIGEGCLGFIFAFSPFTSGNEKVENIDFNLANYNSNEFLNISISKVKYDNVPQLMMKIQVNECFDIPPIINLKCTLGIRNIETNFSLPLLITKFLEPYDTNVENYTPLWYEYSNSTDDSYGRLDAVMYNPMANSGRSIMDFLKKFGLLMQNLNFKVFAPQDRTNFHEIEGCALFKSQNYNIPILFQASFVPSMNEEFRFSLRNKNENPGKFSNILLNIYAVVKMWVNPN